MKVLVAYESKHGSTKAIAERIAATLAGYDAYIIGSAVYYDGWMKEAIKFVPEHERALAGKPVWLFSSGPVGTALPADPEEIGLLRKMAQQPDHHIF